MNITEYTVELVKDPFGIISGKRYEYFIDLDIDEEDELFSENGVSVRVIYKVDGKKEGIVKYELLERTTHKLLDFDLEQDEVEELAVFCKEHLAED
ncbi:DUF6509 family protein [Gorillibacterium massiliense]|uniref:DUF6509 family protein n=1 Tax=Gorillibacterium massiliense TaxID=1280390 RepID=UPI0004BB5E4A|nr:DUF6509 family protein [Gorillibacterium massiliense]